MMRGRRVTITCPDRRFDLHSSGIEARCDIDSLEVRP
jgi:hypothetical protein